MEAKLRAGVVGVGHLGRHHARLYATLPRTTLVGVVDADPAQAAAIAAQHGARVFPTVEALAAEVDALSVATPTTFHEEVALPLLEAGKSVLVEKPITTTVEAGRRLIAAARKSGATLMVGHVERFNPAIAALRERVRDPRFLEIHRLAPFTPRSLDVDVILDLMIHDLDLCRVLLGPREIVHLDASGTPALTDKIDIASVRIRFAGGAAANVTASRISNEKIRRVRVFEPGRFLACDTGAGTLAYYYVVREPGKPGEVRGETVGLPPEEPLARELSAFADAVLDGGPSPCSGEDGVAALELALRVRDAVEAGV
ncbi:Gfo/Idh/MocA family oxidoreductase [bacterium]|nr:Gfo/Idh/MocA family oxidoreductase [bacterium]